MESSNKISKELIKKYDTAGLKIDRERVLTYSQLSCPLDCTYCFVNDMTTNQQKNIAYLTEKQIELLKNLPEEISLIMLGCDTEFFQNKKEAIEILKKLSGFGKDLSMITKIPIKESFLNEIDKVNQKMKERGNILSVSISIPCLSDEMSKKYEPKVPSPKNRIETLKQISNKGIYTMLAIRPLLPDMSNEELQEIMNLTKDYVIGYYSGPLYLNDDRISKLLPESVVESEAKQPHWMLDGNLFKEVVKKGQIDFLREIVKNSGKDFFEGAAEGMKYIRKIQDEKHRTKS